MESGGEEFQWERWTLPFRCRRYFFKLEWREKEEEVMSSLKFD